MKTLRGGVSFGDADEIDNDGDEQNRKDQESKKMMMRQRSWMLKNKAFVKNHAKDELLNCTNMHVPSLQNPITESSHGLLFKVSAFWNQ